MPAPRGHVISAGGLALVGAALLAASALAQWLLLDDRARAALASVVARLPLLILAVVLGLAAARRQIDPRSRRAWLLLTSAFAVLIPGDVAYAAREALGPRGALQRLPDYCYLAYFPLLLGGLASLPRGFRGRSDALMFALDAGILTIGAAMLLWRFAGVGVDGSGWLDLAYPIGDLLTLLGLSTLMLRRPPASAFRADRWLAAPLLASLIGDLAWVFSQNGELAVWRAVAHLLWAVQPAAFAVAAVRATAERPAVEASVGAWQPSFAALPYAGLALGYAVLAEHWLTSTVPDRGAIPTFAVLLTTLVVLRQAVAQRENSRLVAAQVQRASERRLAALVENASDAVFILDAALAQRYSSPAARRWLGDSDRSLRDALSDADLEALRGYAAATARHGAHARFAVRPRGLDGRDHPAEATLSNQLADPDIAGLVLTLRDVSEREALESQLRAQSLSDPLTGLPNRALFLDRLTRALARHRAGGPGCAAALVDLDHFKATNDALGHAAGDEILTQTGIRLAGALSGTDFLARLGGDEFGILLEDLADADDAAERLRRVQAAALGPLRVAGRGFETSVSIGYALALDAPDTEADVLLRRADIALQMAQGEGGGGVEAWRAERHGPLLDRLALEGRVPALIEAGAFAVRFQPVVRLPDRRPDGLYVRIGWREATCAADDAALEAALRGAHAGLMLGRWMRQVLPGELGPLLRYLPEASRLAIGLRVEAAPLRDPTLVGDLTAMLARLELAPAQLICEIPPRALRPASAAANIAIERLRAAGIGVALGDFGADAASLELLDGYRFDGLVLAPDAVEALAHRRPGVLLRAAIGTARSLALRIVAPEVREAAQIDALAELGCGFAFGPLIAPPMGYEHLLTWLGTQVAERRAARAE